MFGYGYQDGNESQLSTNVTINGTYLPSQTLTCAIHNAGVEPGWIEYTEGTSYTINHSNPQCDGYPPLDFGYHPGVRIYIDESLGTPNNSEVLEGVQNGQYYWGDVGSELNYTTLNTTNGPDDAFITMSTTLPPDTPGSFNTDTRYIRLNQGYASPSTFWAHLTAHELGHAVGFNHASGPSSNTVLNAVYQFTPGLQPRVLDKCGAVRAFPIDTQ